MTPDKKPSIAFAVTWISTLAILALVGLGYTEDPKGPGNDDDDPCDPWPEDCCDQFRCAGEVPYGLIGGVLCCNGEKVSCAWLGGPPWPTPTPPAQPYLPGSNEGDPGSDLFAKCTREHEDTHHDDVWDCEDAPNAPPCGGCPFRPGWKPGVDPNEEECEGYRATLKCLERERANCQTEECRENLRRLHNYYVCTMKNKHNCGDPWPDEIPPSPSPSPSPDPKGEE